MEKRDLAICTTCGQEYVNVYQPGGSMEGREGEGFSDAKKFEFRDITECVECLEEFVRLELMKKERKKDE